MQLPGTFLAGDWVKQVGGEPEGCDGLVDAEVLPQPHLISSHLGRQAGRHQSKMPFPAACCLVQGPMLGDGCLPSPRLPHNALCAQGPGSHGAKGLCQEKALATGLKVSEPPVSFSSDGPHNRPTNQPAHQPRAKPCGNVRAFYHLHIWTQPLQHAARYLGALVFKTQDPAMRSQLQAGNEAARYLGATPRVVVREPEPDEAHIVAAR